MTWYYVALWPGVGYTLDETLVYAFSEQQAIAMAALSGCGERLSVYDYERYLDFMGIPENQREYYEDARYTYFDEEGFSGYINLDNAIVREAEPEDMLKLDEISFYIRIPGSAEWTRMVRRSGEEFRSAVYSMDQAWWNSEVYRVAINGYNYPFSGTLGELIDELQLSDADQIGSRNVKPKAKMKKSAKKVVNKTSAKKKTAKPAAKRTAANKTIRRK